MLRDQVWVDIGAVKDASFKKAPSKKFQVGDAVKGLIEFIDVKKAFKTHIYCCIMVI